MAAYTWDTRELPILEAVANAEEDGVDPSGPARAAVPDLDDRLYGLTVNALRDDGFLDALVVETGSGELAIAVPSGLTPDGRRATGQWPSRDPGELILQVVRSRIEVEQDPERKSRLHRLLEALGALSKDVLTEVAVGVLKGAAGMP